MGGFSVIHWLFLFAVLLVPVWKVVAKAGYSGAWALLILVPVVNIAALWVFACARWPSTPVRS
jgi:hypothetical protein